MSNLCKYCKSEDVLELKHIEDWKPKELLVVCRNCGLTSFYPMEDKK